MPSHTIARVLRSGFVAAYAMGLGYASCGASTQLTQRTKMANYWLSAPAALVAAHVLANLVSIGALLSETFLLVRLRRAAQA